MAAVTGPSGSDKETEAVLRGGAFRPAPFPRTFKTPPTLFHQEAPCLPPAVLVKSLLPFSMESAPPGWKKLKPGFFRFRGGPGDHSDRCSDHCYGLALCAR